MPHVRRAQLPSGAHDDLVRALRELHLRAGQPSLRRVARAARGVSHDTVHRLLVGATVPSWGALELVVEVLEGEVDEFRQLWMCARRQAESDLG